jgi:N-acetylmuramoyl-L-alanine amidase
MLRRSLSVFLLCTVLISIIGYVLHDQERTETASLAPPGESPLFVPYGHIPVIDPGHGGFDPGTQSAGGVLEKDINLAIGLKTDLLMRFLGLKTVMTRESDEVFHDLDAVSIHDRKVSDMNNRVKLVNETENGVLLSIHQNYYDQRQYYGAQVFYHGAANKDFAESMQKTLRSSLDKDNTRQSKVRDNIFLLNNVTAPAVLIECGFLSNPEEAVLLNSSGYQRKIALAITKGFLDWSATNET